MGFTPMQLVLLLSLAVLLSFLVGAATMYMLGRPVTDLFE